MNPVRMTVSGLCAAAFSIVAFTQIGLADEYVWARTNWGSGSVNRPLSAWSNGYGGYYVPRNAYGNNHEGQPFTNPTGYVIPAQPTYSQPATHQPRLFHRLFHR